MSSKYRIIPIGGGGGITPTGTLDIRSEGVFDVTDYASVDVDIFDDTTTKTITNNGTYNASDDHVLGYSQVTVDVPSPVYQSKIVDPLTTSQTVEPDSGYNALSDVVVNGVTSAIDANIIASNIRDGVTILGVTGTYTGGSMIDPQDFLQFYNPNSGSVSISVYSDGQFKAKLYYSKDYTLPLDTWSVLDNTTTINLSSGETVYIYGNNPLGLSYARFITGGCECHGNIMSLLSLEDKTVAPAFAFSQLFLGTSITTSPDLPATFVGTYAYESMFCNCTSLTQAPALPATTLSDSCYQNMFLGCTALTQAPALPATTLANSCYSGMLASCANLTQAPVLPATTLAPSCYQSMFQYCYSLTEAPELPATNLDISCYAQMFLDCVSLTQAPALPATTIDNGCYSSMFQGCTSLTHAPALPATTLYGSCYYAMFQDCTSLTRAPSLPATTLADSCYAYMFFNCSSMSEISLSFSDTQDQKWYDQDNNWYPFSENWTDGVAQSGTFKKLGNANIPTNDPNSGIYSGIPENWTVQTVDYFYIQNVDRNNLSTQISFGNDGSDYSDFELYYSSDASSWTRMSQSIVLSAGDNLYFYGENPTFYTNNQRHPFHITGGDVIIGGDISCLQTRLGEQTTATANQFSSFFQNCTAIISAGALILPYTTLGLECYSGMFSGCSSMADAPALPATTLANSCYASMFWGCRSLTEAPILPATRIVYGCYYYMFNGCSRLNRVICHATNWDTSFTSSWLNGVSPTGDFYNLGGATIPTGNNGIPSGWTEHTSL